MSEARTRQRRDHRGRNRLRPSRRIGFRAAPMIRGAIPIKRRGDDIALDGSRSVDVS
jgi:hypothetical protein